jgi:hypothetical protein
MPAPGGVIMEDPKPFRNVLDIKRRIRESNSVLAELPETREEQKC